MLRKLLCVVGLVAGAPVAANTWNADSAVTSVITQQDAKGPSGCGYRTIAAVDHQTGRASIADIQLVLSLSEERMALFGLMKVRTTRHEVQGQDLPIVSMADLTQASISTNDFLHSARPASGLSKSEDSGYFIGGMEGAEFAPLVFEAISGVTLIYSYKDAANPAQESIRFRVILSEEDAQTLKGCSASLMSRLDSLLSD